MLAALALLGLCGGALADVYLNNPRGSNNKLSEQSNNAQNQNRLFDSQNNAAGGYQIGDDCRPVCQNGNRNYNANEEGAMKGIMTYYQGSELYVEWYSQHGCGLGHPNLRCQMILQYMTEADNPGLRDGTKRGNQNTAGGRQEPPQDQAARDPALGQHETVEFYQACKARERNKGLYTADQNVQNNRGATATRQNPNGNANANQRHGLECPEERDYYPYWHPSPWHDIAIFTDEPLERCAYYQAESQNVKAKGYCSDPEHNNPQACGAAGATWHEQAAFGQAPPECAGGIQSRDNHNGNARNGKPMYYNWRIPETISGRAVLRLRYNITTLDLDPGAVVSVRESEETDGLVVEGADAFFVDEKFNDRNPGQRRRAIFRAGRPIVSNDPKADFVNIGSTDKSRVLQVQLNTNQVARTFEDRTHTFLVRGRPANVPEDARIVNYNVRGRRGNIVQVYPSVEYDFVPQDLTVEAGTFLHFQWVGSDANPQGNAGNGRQGTDRSNLVQVAMRGENVPMPIEQHTLFFDAKLDPNNPEGRALVDRFAYLDQDSLVTCDPEENNDQATDNCKQLNGASAYFDGGVIEMKQVGTHHVASTRNNDFSNRSQKASITVTKKPWAWYAVLCLWLGTALTLALASYFAAAYYALKVPTSWLFSKRYRPRVAQWLVPRAVFQKKLDERRSFHRHQKEHLAALMTSAGAEDPSSAPLGKALDSGAEEAPTASSGKVAGAASRTSRTAAWQGGSTSCLRRCQFCGLGEQRLSMALYLAMNVAVFLVGFFQHLGMGFQGCIAYPLAKACGFTLDLNFAFLVLPTLKSLQTAMRSAGSTREWIPIDDPISFHIAVAVLTLIGSVGHIASHIVHMLKIASAPPVQQDPLSMWGLTDTERTSGTPLWTQCWNLGSRCAPVTGALVTLLMVLMTITAMPCARRGTNACTRRLGGYNLFWRAHLSWKWVYVLLLFHAPQRLWIWLLFPAILFAVDRAFLANRQRPYVALRHVKLLPRDVIHLTFDVPHGFTYQAGQYILLGWRGEWHPFTLTSAPEERCLSVHIRAPDTLDWCSALRHRLAIEAPAQAAAASGVAKEAAAAAASEDARTRSKSGTLPPVDGHGTSQRDRTAKIKYVTRACSNGQVVYSQPAPLVGTASGERSAERSGSRSHDEKPSSVSAIQVSIEIPHEKSTFSMDSTRLEKLPPDAVVLQITGPFGAPAQKIWQFETIMAVGAGIGVTPFASILKSVQIRAKQRQAIQGALSKSRSSSSRKKDDDIGSARQSVEQLLNDVVTVPKRIYFYWIVRSQEEVEWFWDLLAEAVQGPAQDNVHVTLFTTGEVELQQVRKLSFVHSQVFGRPNWGRIFKKQREDHKGEHIGVFLCGSPLIGKELGRQSAKHTDPQGCEGGTRFSFFKEHF